MRYYIWKIYQLEYNIKIFFKKLFSKKKQIIYINNDEEMDRYIWFDAKEDDIVYVAPKISFSWYPLINAPRGISFRNLENKEWWYTSKTKK